MAFRRRRGRKGLWLPVLGHDLDGGGGVLRESSFERNIQVGPTPTDIFSISVPVTFDYPPEIFDASANFQPSMGDFISSGYSLRRIVGKCTVMHATKGNDDVGATAPPCARVVCYWMVRRVDSAGNEVADANMLAGNLAENIQDPYIWRNTWLLGAGFDATRYPLGTDHNQLQDLPFNNEFSGSSRTQPFFDIKTKRTIGPEERLFFGITTKSMPMDAVFDDESFVVVHVDFRIFAFPTRVYGNRRNASR